MIATAAWPHDSGLFCECSVSKVRGQIAKGAGLPSLQAWVKSKHPFRVTTVTVQALARFHAMGYRSNAVFDHKLRRLAVTAFNKVPPHQQLAGIAHQRRAAANHDTVMLRLEFRQFEVRKQLA